MENPAPLRPPEDIVQPSPARKYLGLSTLAGFLYGVPTALIGFAVTLLFLLYLIFAFILSTPKISNPVLVGLPVFVGLTSGVIAGLVGGRASFQHANQDGTPRTVGYGILSCAGIGLIGLLVFPMLCGAAYFLMVSALDKLGLLNDALSDILMGGGSESGVFIVLAGCLIPISAVLAYMTAVLFGGVIYRRLSKNKKPAN